MSGEEGLLAVEFEVIVSDDGCSYTLVAKAGEVLTYQDFLQSLATFLDAEIDSKEEPQHVTSH